MPLPLKLICKKNKTRKDGTSLIFIQYCFSPEKRTLLSTGISIPPEYWKSRMQKISSGLPPEFGDYSVFNDLLVQQFRKVEDLILKAIKSRELNHIEYVKDRFSADVMKLEEENRAHDIPDIFLHIDEFIKSKERTVRPCTVGVITCMKEHLQEFEKFRQEKITYETINTSFYEDFVHFLTYHIVKKRRKEEIKGLKLNTIGKTIKWLKNFLQSRIGKVGVPLIDLRSFKFLEENVDSVYLGWAEISRIYHLDLSEISYLAKYRDLFVLGCLTGLRFSDYSGIKPEDLRDGMLHIRQTKTGASVVIPLRKDAVNILIEKYKMNMPKVSNPDFNYYIKEVAKLAGIDEPVKITHKRGNNIIEETRPKYAWVTSHTCRRSFCTNEFLDGTPVMLIMSISGHKSEKQFRRYVKADNLQKAQMISNIWAKRKKL